MRKKATRESSGKRTWRGEDGNTETKEEEKRLKVQTSVKPHISISLRHHHLLFLKHRCRRLLQLSPVFIVTEVSAG